MLLLKPLQIKTGKSEATSRKCGNAFAVTAAPVEAEDGAFWSHGDVGIHAGSVFEQVVDGPAYAFVTADLHADIFAIAVLPGFGFAVRFVEIVRVGKKNEILSIVIITDDAAHANGLEESIVKLRCAPASGAIFTNCDESAVCLGFTPDIEHHAAIV